MNQVTEQVRDLYGQALGQLRRREAGLPVEPRAMHMVFAGESGTGKTTVAEQIGKLYHALGLLPKDKFVEVDRSQLVGDVMGETEQKTRAAFEKARGGVLFIDEAYSLVESKQDMYGKQAVNELVALMDKHRDDTVVIMAGYPKEMKTLLESNPGLPSRLPTTITFPKYTPTEQHEILMRFQDKGAYTMTPQTRKQMRAAVKSAGTGGNAREVRNLHEKILMAQERRLAALDEPSTAQLRRIEAEDVAEGLRRYSEQKPLTAPRSKASA
jgi:SpoVK/Ycf46/Vps4 family AAA+-type ATPase